MSALYWSAPCGAQTKLTNTRRPCPRRVDFDELLTRDKPVIFALHAGPWLIIRPHNIEQRASGWPGTATTGMRRHY